MRRTSSLDGHAFDLYSSSYNTWDARRKLVLLTGAQAVALQEPRDPLGDGFGALDVEEVTDALDPTLLDVRKRRAEQLGNLHPQGLGLGTQHGECRLGDGSGRRR